MSSFFCDSIIPNPITLHTTPALASCSMLFSFSSITYVFLMIASSMHGLAPSCIAINSAFLDTAQLLESFFLVGVLLRMFGLFDLYNIPSQVIIDGNIAIIKVRTIETPSPP